MKTVFLLLIPVIFLFCACNNTSSDEGIDQAQNPVHETALPENTEIEEEIIDFVLMTKEEFIRLIEENDMGVIIEDFDGIDIDDFIFEYGITKELVDELNIDHLPRWLGNYIKNTPQRERERQRAPFLVYELKYVDSTEQEYKAFIDKYLNVLDVSEIVHNKEKDGFDFYLVEIVNQKGSIHFYFCQTSKSKVLPIAKGDKGTEENYKIEVAAGSGEYYYTDFYYSKIGKYLMHLEYSATVEYGFEETLNFVRTFCELDDLNAKEAE